MAREIREALRLILDYEFQHPDILLVEEPEIHLHPALETSMMRYLKKTGQDCQIFITTHSTNFLDTAEMRNVYLVAKDKSTVVTLVNMAEAETAIPRELGIRLSSLFMFDKLVFVEGLSDEHVIREWASTLRVNLAQGSIGFVPMGGVRNLAHFATEQTINFLSKRRVKMWFIIDRDERDQEEIKRLTDRLENRAILKVLKRRELENYLIVPRVVAEFVGMKRALANSKDRAAPSEDEVRKVIAEKAESLKNVALARRMARWACHPYYLDRTAVLAVPDPAVEARIQKELEGLRKKIVEKLAELPERMESESRSLGSRWEAEKTYLVPGDLLLDEVCKHFGCRFVKEKDSPRVAALMAPGEIAAEIQAVVREIEDG
jgi:putative ATP-dependent endonuclease of OLD family